MEEKEGSAEEARVVGSAAVKVVVAAVAELVETVVVVMVVAAAEMEVEEAVTAEVGVPAVVVSSEASRAVDWTMAG